MFSCHRIDAEAIDLKNKLVGIIGADKPSSEDENRASNGTAKATVEVIFGCCDCIVFSHFVILI